MHSFLLQLTILIKNVFIIIFFKSILILRKPSGSHFNNKFAKTIDRKFTQVSKHVTLVLKIYFIQAGLQFASHNIKENTPVKQSV